MKKPLEFYNQQKGDFEQTSLKLKTKLINFGLLRLASFISTCFLIYLTFYDIMVVVPTAFIGFSLFAFFVFQYINIKKKKAIVDKKIAMLGTEIDVLYRKFHHLPSGNEFINPTHFYSNDIDLFGRGSFFQYMNRTTTQDGKQKLAEILTENAIANIDNKQEAVKELSEKVKWRLHFSALASLVSVKNTSTSIVNWILNYQSRLPNYLLKIQLVFAAFSVGLILLVSFNFISFNFITAWFFIGLFITGRFIKKTNTLYTETDKIRETFKQYHQLLNEIENETFVSKNLVNQQKIIQSETKKASAIFRQFSKILDAFDNRNNIIIAVLGNGLFLWEIANACKVEKWITKYKHIVEQWFEVIAYFDAHNSLANFVFNHPKFVFPEISTGKTIIESENLGHPLLDATKRIDNNFMVDEEQFFIITGANMAGKSTFLRTVSLSIVMSNCGLPVCATSFKYTPIQLITSMRTSDSLADDASYFYSELKRLKFIVDKIKTEKYFIILDEILKGTNSKDKAVGSKQFVEKLTKSKSTGIIATHDVSLCELENEFSTIKNYYFDAEIINNELYFDYTLKNGICKNMNASFLLKKMEIV